MATLPYIEGPAAYEQRLRETELQYESLFAGAPMACHEIDTQGTVVRVNPAECALLGFSAEEMIGRPIWEFMALDEQERSAAALRLKFSGEEALTRIEREYRRQDGARLFLEIHPKLIRDASGKVVGIRSFMVDNTERRLAEQTLRKQAKELARSNAELEQFAYVASHDLQEPLRKIQAFGDRLKTKCADSLSDDGRDYLGRMQNAAGRMQTLIHDLLALSRVATNPQPFAAVDLHAVAWDVVSDLESRIEQLGGRVEIGALPAVMADRLQMSQLLQNLIGNALKFHKPGHRPVVQVQAEAVPLTLDAASHATTAPLCRLIVQDNGIGFDAKYQERIFQVFQRLHGRNEYEGSGIGLAICRKIAERHGGSITAQSTPGSGARFIVTLPCLPAASGHPARTPFTDQLFAEDPVTGESFHG
jgi:two-component system, LuxR family, sensor kinase FixL